MSALSDAYCRSTERVERSARLLVRRPGTDCRIVGGQPGRLVARYVVPGNASDCEVTGRQTDFFSRIFRDDPDHAPARAYIDARRRVVSPGAQLGTRFSRSFCSKCPVRARLGMESRGVGSRWNESSRLQFRLFPARPDLATFSSRTRTVPMYGQCRDLTRILSTFWRPR
jgi:hypothetical protein